MVHCSSKYLSCVILSQIFIFEQLLILEYTVCLLKATYWLTLTLTLATHNQAQHLMCMEHVTCISIVQCFIFFFWVCEEIWKACCTPVKISPAGLSSQLLYNKLLERCYWHLTQTHTLNQWIPLPTSACKTTHLLPVDIMLWMKLYS